MSYGHKIMSLCLEQGTGQVAVNIKSNYHETKQTTFVSFLVSVGCRERTRHFDARPKTAGA